MIDQDSTFNICLIADFELKNEGQKKEENKIAMDREVRGVTG